MFMYGYDFEEGGPASYWASTQGLNQNIHFCGLLPPHELHIKLKEMSLLLHPALEEACPLALLESMALGLPIVAGRNAGGVPWVLDSGKAGFLTDVRNPAKIALTLLTCVEKKDVRQERQRNARERVARLFSPTSVAEQYEKMYQKVLS
jgi:glycosyltransferase involved in cell wall biosynthesis